MNVEDQEWAPLADNEDLIAESLAFEQEMGMGHDDFNEYDEYLAGQEVYDVNTPIEAYDNHVNIPNTDGSVGIEDDGLVLFDQMINDVKTRHAEPSPMNARPLQTQTTQPPQQNKPLPKVSMEQVDDWSADEWDDFFDNQDQQQAQVAQQTAEQIITQSPTKSLEEAVEELLEGLNPEQRAAAEAIYGPVMVIAGAGAGKTATLIRRISNLMLHGVQPGNILALTFTNKAAGEIKNRITGLVGEMGDHVVAGTFHSMIFRQILKQNSESKYLQNIGIDVSELNIMDDTESDKLMKDSIKELSDQDLLAIEENEWKLDDFKSEMTLFRAEGMDHKAYERTIVPGNKRQVFQHVLVNVWRVYAEKCRMVNGIDFDDILVVSNNMLKAEPEIAKELANQFQYIHLDEYQDTNQVQMEIMDRIASHHRNIFVVGDEKQAIYGFRGSKYEVIMSFMKRYTEAKKVVINRNYRSNAEIIDFSNGIARSMPEKLSDGQLIPESKNTALAPKVVKFKNAFEEAELVVKSIQKDIATGTPADEIAVLYRNRHMKDLVEKKLVERNIDYTLTGDTSFYQRAEVKDAVAMVRFIARPWDSSAGLRLLKAARIGTSDAAATKAINEKGQNVHTFLESKGEERMKTKKKGEDEFPPTAAAKKAKPFIGLVNGISEAIADKDDPDLIKQYMIDFWDIYLRPGVAKAADKSNQKTAKVQENSKKDNVLFIFDRLIEGIKDGKSINDIIDDITLMIDSQHDLDTAPRVQLMTNHASKGLEFDNVYLIGNEADHKLNPKEKKEEFNEERRIFYVASTRAKKKLSISYAEERQVYGDRREQNISPFLDESLQEKPDTPFISYQAPQRQNNGYNQGYGRGGYGR